MTDAESARRWGRRLGLGVFMALMAAFTVVCSVQIILQVWFPKRSSASPECHASLEQLIQSIPEARAAARGPGGEQKHVARFRAALEPAWRLRPELDRACADDPAALAALRSVDELRYAEENAVRYDATELSRRRRRVAALKEQLFGGK